MDDQDKILSYLRLTGPVLPAQVAKNINSNILLASAHLSDLASQGKIKLSSLKIGGSPLYYLSEHREKLQNFINNLNPKDQDYIQKLKENKILRDSDLELLGRVAMRNVKDFAVQLNVNLNGDKEVFWKWYLLSDEEASALIKERLGVCEESKDNEKHEKAEETAEVKEKEALGEERTEAELKQESSEKESEVEEEPDNNQPEKQEKLVEDKKPLLQKIKDKFKHKKKEVPDEFLPVIQAFFDERNITISTKETLRKNSEMNFVVEVPSVIGKLNYFCKAKNKKRCDEKDLSAAYMEAQSKKMPLLFLYTNEISKKAQEMLESGAFDNLTIKKIEQEWD